MTGDSAQLPCGPEKIVVTPDGRAHTQCGCGANLLPGELFGHLTGGAEGRMLLDRWALGVGHLIVEPGPEAEAWLVPPVHRSTCPVDGEPCKSWTCLVDVCVGKRKAVLHSTGEEGPGSEE